MRFLAVLAILILAGCSGVADPSDLRAPRTQLEWAEYSQHVVRLNRVLPQLSAANRDLCPNGCPFTVNLNVADGIGAFSDANAAYVSFPMMRFLRDDDELAYIVAHEWSHALLKHHGSGAPKYLMETEADCVGTLLAARAGYRLGAGVEPLRRMTYSTLAAWMGQVPDALPRAQYVQRVTEAARGRTITRAGIKSVCGVGP